MTACRRFLKLRLCLLSLGLFHRLPHQHREIIYKVSCGGWEVQEVSLFKIEQKSGRNSHKGRYLIQGSFKDKHNLIPATDTLRAPGYKIKIARILLTSKMPGSFPLPVGLPAIVADPFHRQASILRTTT
jgi:hypothetical protein